ncbi:amidase [Enhydrobacter aerosaccus]|uniref:Amidase n=1 Tax=Enhydrobacter aerosaccus TaxID=225324 RepID=A0A1T4KZH0_9HYPH|nr:amidase family protein [Enhydrobacter aerosaccus]SJZ47771.1 amidase [Enhydrobacter aerosaccus]
MEEAKGNRTKVVGADGVTRRELATLPLVIGAIASTSASAQGGVAIDNASLADVQQALAAGTITSSALTQAYLARIEAYDRAGPRLNSVREVNPDALPIAARLDGVKPSTKQPLAGVPILVKDNIATGDKQHTTAGSLALDGAGARNDSTVVKQLRAAGAVILGKANLTEFANILAIGMPSGYSSLGGQVKNPYAPSLMVDEIVPVVQPGGSSAGSAVAVAAGLCAAAIGTETSGSLLSPATQNGVVTVKPTVGLIGRSGIIPISHSQDTAGPMTRTVRDAAILLNVLAAPDPHDPVTQHQQRPQDYTTGLDKEGLKGARIGIPSDPDDPLNDPFYGPLPQRSKEVMAQAIKVLQDLGATVVHAAIPEIGWIGGPGTTMAVLNRNPLGVNKGTPGTASLVFLYELKHDLNLYLRDWATGTRIKTLADVIAFNKANADKALRKRPRAICPN